MSKNSAIFKNILKILLIEFAAIIFSVLTIVAAGTIFYYMSFYFFPPINEQPNTDDLGRGVVIVLFLFFSLLVSLPLSVVIHIILFKKFKGKSS